MNRPILLCCLLVTTAVLAGPKKPKQQPGKKYGSVWECTQAGHDAQSCGSALQENTTVYCWEGRNRCNREDDTLGCLNKLEREGCVIPY